MSVCAILIPVLNRPERVLPLIESLDSSLVDAEATLYFIVSEHDKAEREALWDAGAAGLVVPWERAPGDYARKINHGVRVTEEPWLFLGADDLRFHEGWLDTALRFAERWRKRVVGTNDLGNREVKAGRHSTHSLVARSYVEEEGTADRPGIALHEGYDHQYVDNEFIETAKWRSEFIHSPRSVVEHLHPHWGKGPTDDTYRMALAEMDADRKLFRSRRSLWKGGRVQRGVQARARAARR